jgi:aryl-alcohol dehydrogenase-like predicted oxidoreductase
MKRRKFLTAALLAGTFGRFNKERAMNALTKLSPGKVLQRRRYRDDVELSVIGFGGIVLLGMMQEESNNVVAEAIDHGVNYFDVAPSYGDGEAEEKLGPALLPYRKKIFLACKTMERNARGAEAELQRSLRRLKTDHLDLYQFHAVTRIDEVEQIFAPRGAAEATVKAREEGKIRYVGFSAHSEGAALAMMERFAFDSLLFPVNFVCYARGNFGPAVLDVAGKKGIARLALKMLTRGPWPQGLEKNYPKAWYEPIDDPELARKAVRFTLSEDVTAAIPPGDIRLFRLAVSLAAQFTPLSVEERRALFAETDGMTPLFRS